MRETKKLETAPLLGLDEATFKIELPLSVYAPFCDVLLNAIDEAFLPMGESAKTSIYFHLENSIGLNKQEIPSRIDDFQNGLEKIFGIGARYLEILIMKSLYSRIGDTPQSPNNEPPASELTFKEYVCLLKKNYEMRMSQEKAGV